MATAMGPMPPGTGVKTEATAAQASVASPESFPPCSLVPASIKTTPCFNISGFISPGSPAPSTTISAVLSCSKEPRVCVITDTSAPSSRRSLAAGAPTSRPAPTTTTLFPLGFTSCKRSTSCMAPTTGARTNGARPNASTSFFGGKAASKASEFGIGNCTITPSQVFISSSSSPRTTTTPRRCATRLLIFIKESVALSCEPTTMPRRLPRRDSPSPAIISSAIFLPSTNMLTILAFCKKKTPPRLRGGSLLFRPFPVELVLNDNVETVEFRLPARQNSPHATHIGNDRRNIASSTRTKGKRKIHSAHSLNRVNHLEYGIAFAVTAVDGSGSSAHPQMAQCLHMRLCKVGDMDKVSHRRTVKSWIDRPKDLKAFSASRCSRQSGLDEMRGLVLKRVPSTPLRVCARHVEVTQYDKTQSRSCLGRITNDLLSHELGPAVRTRRCKWDIFRHRDLAWIAVHCCRRREDKVLHLAGNCRLEHRARCLDVVAVVFERVCYRLFHFDRAGKMHDKIGRARVGKEGR